MLTTDDLKNMQLGQIIGSGIGIYPELYKEKIRWVAVRGEGYHDWALYYHLSQNDIDYVIKCGDKSFTEKIIRKLVPCDDEAWGLYRF